MERRPIKARSTTWAKVLAKALVTTGVTPNQISLLSILFGLASGLTFAFSSTNLGLFISALLIQMRLVCNLMDGMVAVEHKKKTKSGDIFNDFPDRFADFFIIVGFGHGLNYYPYAIEMAYTAAAFAIMTAYIRVLGASLKTEHYFIGPMAKQHRMALITSSSLAQIAFNVINIKISVAYYALIVLTLGTIITCLRRLIKIIHTIEEQT